MELGPREGKELAHCHTASKWLSQTLYSAPPHCHHDVPSAKNAFPSLSCRKAPVRLFRVINV